MDLMVIGCTWSTMCLVVDSCTVYNGLDGGLLDNGLDGGLHCMENNGFDSGWQADCGVCVCVCISVCLYSANALLIV